MDYYESKIKGIIREGMVNCMSDLATERVKGTGNPYAAAELLNDTNHKALNDATDTIYQNLKEKGFVK